VRAPRFEARDDVGAGAAALDGASVIGQSIGFEGYVDLEPVAGRRPASRGLDPEPVPATFQQPDVAERLGVQPRQVLPVEDVLAHARERGVHRTLVGRDAGEPHDATAYQNPAAGASSHAPVTLPD
jgi:hypothetical protein